MSIADKIFIGHKTFKEEYKEDPDLLFVSSYAHEQICSAPEFERCVQSNVVGCELIPVLSMDQEYRFLTREDVEQARTSYNNSPSDPVLIRKLVKTDRSEAANARRLGEEKAAKHLYVPLDIIRAYERHFGNKDLNF
ncbi:hypothetical protein ODQ17_17060 [Acinetobacter sp. IRS14]|uniref:hypothetical protein n=1 Tax=Acinetobacter sp. IRS14 TaxID=2983398 RepID=UPI002AFDC96F|nr:hypothetical protein [Acinetobacter sp. IRS14]MEA1231086.1 hypothetical protein [Acinetobacter sp. IRS14]